MEHEKRHTFWCVSFVYFSGQRNYRFHTEIEYKSYPARICPDSREPERIARQRMSCGVVAIRRIRPLIPPVLEMYRMAKGKKRF